jgi:hypothetical protein
LGVWRGGKGIPVGGGGEGNREISHLIREGNFVENETGMFMINLFLILRLL